MSGENTPGISPSALAAAMASVTAAIPNPASTIPPSIQVTGSVGTQTNAFALANHTHASLVQTQQGISVPAGTSPVTVTWTFPNPNLYTSAPTVLAQGVQAAGSTQPIVCNVIAGSVTPTQCQFRVYQAGAVQVSVLGVSVNIFGGTIPAGTTINCYAHA